MIVKLIESDTSESGVASYVGRLGRYISQASKYVRVEYDTFLDEHTQVEKCLYLAATDAFFAQDLPGRIKEMADLAQANPRVRSNPVEHWILSWARDERPTREEVDGAVKMFLGEMGYGQNQCIYGLHGDTDNWHVHLEVNTIHPLTFARVRPGGPRERNFTVAHRAIAKIEHEYGWRTEENSLFLYDEDGRLVSRRDLEARQEELERSEGRSGKAKRLTQTQQMFEKKTGQKSDASIIFERAKEIIWNAKTWEELHRNLAQEGIRFEKFGGGATLLMHDCKMAASDLGKSYSLKRIEGRMKAPFQSAEECHVELPPLVATEPEPAREAFPGWEEYQAAKAAYRAARDAEENELRAEAKLEWRRFNASCQTMRQGMRRWKRGIPEVARRRAGLHFQLAKEKGRLRAGQRAKRQELAKKYPGGFPDFKAWLKYTKGAPELAELYGRREKEPDGFRPAAGPAQGVEAAWVDVEGFCRERSGSQVFYRREGDPSPVAFVESEGLIRVVNPDDEAAIEAALALAAQKWPQGLKICGSGAFKGRATHAIERLDSRFAIRVEAKGEAGLVTLDETPEKDRYPRHRNISARLFEEFKAQKRVFSAKMREVGENEELRNLAIADKYRKQRQRFRRYPQFLTRLRIMEREDRANSRAKGNRERQEVREAYASSWDAFLERKAQANDLDAQALLAYRRKKAQSQPERPGQRWKTDAEYREDEIKREIIDEIAIESLRKQEDIGRQFISPAYASAMKTVVKMEELLKIEAVKDNALPKLTKHAIQAGAVTFFTFGKVGRITAGAKELTVEAQGPEAKAVRQIGAKLARMKWGKNVISESKGDKLSFAWSPERPATPKPLIRPAKSPVPATSQPQKPVPASQPSQPPLFKAERERKLAEFVAENKVSWVPIDGEAARAFIRRQSKDDLERYVGRLDKEWGVAVVTPADQAEQARVMEAIQEAVAKSTQEGAAKVQTVGPYRGLWLVASPNALYIQGEEGLRADNRLTFGPKTLDAQSLVHGLDEIIAGEARLLTAAKASLKEKIQAPEESHGLSR